jgi:predicted MFS family arabinose efflux permease
LRYGALLRSVLELVRTQRVLRRRAFHQALMFGMFSAFWTEVSYELASRHHLGQSEIGIFALVGAAGAGAAPLAGKLGDRGLGSVSTGAASALGAASMLLAGLGSGSLALLAIAGVLMDLAVQTTMVLGQHQVYAVNPAARSRITTVYLATIFAGGAISSALSGTIYAQAGWGGVTVFAGALPLAALVLWLSWNLFDRRQNGGGSVYVAPVGEVQVAAVSGSR